ncbi:TPA: transcriptional regulator, partial [Klebsiella pneumoniae]
WPSRYFDSEGKLLARQIRSGRTNK